LRAMRSSAKAAVCPPMSYATVYTTRRSYCHMVVGERAARRRASMAERLEEGSIVQESRDAQRSSFLLFRCPPVPMVPRVLERKEQACCLPRYQCFIANIRCCLALFSLRFRSREPVTVLRRFLSNCFNSREFSSSPCSAAYHPTTSRGPRDTPRRTHEKRRERGER